MADQEHLSNLPESPSLRELIGAEQVAAVFRNVTLGVSGAAAGSIILSVILIRIGGADPLVVLAWSGFITACAFAHVLLRRAYDRANSKTSRWETWGRRFSAIVLAEGIGWGWATIGLVSTDNFALVLLVLVVAFAVAAGAIPAFGPYSPAFFALFIPATFPYAIVSLESGSSLQQASVLLAIVFIAGMGALGVGTNRSFRENVRLRLETERMAEALRRQKEIAEQASLAKSTFLAAASHDLRQPVHALGLFVGALRIVSMDDEGRRLVKQIETSLAAMDGLFSALLDISRLDAGVVEVHRRPFALDPLLTRICSDSRLEAEAKRISLVYKRCSLAVETDPVLLERIVRNLVSNAVRYTDCGRIVVGCRRSRSHVSIQVWDTGRGIPREQHERIFQEYYQIGNPERDRAKGLGLGLAIVRRLTALLHCPLTLRSAPGKGSCFAIALPIAERGAADPADCDLSGALAACLVLVVDDEIAIRDAMASLLGGWGHQVVTAGSGDDALRCMADLPRKPDIIISDLRLREDETGIEVIERIRAEYNDTIPALLITGDTAPERLAEAQKSGLLLLHKPVSNSKLRAAIANLSRGIHTSASLQW
jgi:signal transduction histidine kinase/CheY-like chemotaxis protein